MRYLVLFILLITSCESYLYDDYKIISLESRDGKSKNNISYKERYLVKKGDNLYSISRKFTIPIQEIIKVNKIKEPYKIYPNQVIYLPLLQTHRIKKGDTLYSISRSYGTNVFSLAKLNNILNVNNISIGEKLVIPNRNEKNNKKVSPKSKKKWNREYVNRKKQVLKNNEIKNKSITKFIWPVRGKLISKYGKSKEGFYNDGINIVSQKGTVVISSQDGKVIYSGNEIPGYGNLILIKHSKNWITAYAHLSEVFIEKGRLVKKGQKIGSVGSTGNVRSPQLHFEIRKGKEAVDPLEFL